MKVTQLNPRLEQSLKGRTVFLVSATFRPETMYGVTCCMVLPAGNYVAVEMQNEEVFICS
jgi:leucyl-tRNA synthetase